MINLISFYYDENFTYKDKDRISHITDSLRFHIDNLESNRWNKDQLIIKTNFLFEYKGISNVFFNDDNNRIPQNLFLTKFLAIYETLQEYPNEIIWFHDVDTFQLKPFNLFDIESLLCNLDILYCNYWPGYPRPQGASVFYKGMTKNIEDIYSVVINNIKLSYDDEQILQKFSIARPDRIKATLPYEYNTSITKTSSNKRTSKNPYCLHGNIFQSRFCRRLYHKFLNERIL